MEQEYLIKKKTLQKTLLEYINNQGNCEENYQNLINLVFDQKLKNDENELRLFLLLLANISYHHFRNKDFFSKIEKIILFFKEEIKKFLTDEEIFTIFSFNKIILLFLIENDIIHLNPYLSNKLASCKFGSFGIYFYDEISKYLTIDSEKIDDESFQEKRRIGENDQEICKIIRDDMISEFITYVNKNDIPLGMKIKQSIYETNYFLFHNTPNLIEYSAFFGSIQIFKYLFKNGVELTSSLWLYSIHGAHPEIIKILEDKNVKPEDETYKDCILEAIKCHQNDLVHYLASNLHENAKYNIEVFIASNCIKFYNFEFFTEELNSQNNFYNFCKFDYFYLVKQYLMNHDFDINFKVKDTIDEVSYLVTPLLIAVSNDNYNIVELLLKQPNIDINFKMLTIERENNLWKVNAIYCTILNNSIKMLKLLLTNEKININFRVEIYCIKHSKSIFSKNSILNEIVLKKLIDSIEFLKLILSHQNIDVNIYNEYKEIYNNKLHHTKATSLIWAIEIENVEIMKILLKHPKIDVNIQSIVLDNEVESKYTPLIYAFIYNKIEAVKILLSHPKIDVNKPIKSNDIEDSIRTPLFFAFENSNDEIIKLLLSHPNIDVNMPIYENKNPKIRKTALTMAIQNQKNEIVELLLSNPNIDVNAPLILNEDSAKSKSSPLNLAINNDNQKAAILLLSHHNIDVNIKTIKKINNNDLIKKEELSSLYFAIKKNNFEVIQILLSKQNTNFNNKTMVFTKDNFYIEETTALQYAILNKNVDIIEYMLDCLQKNGNLNDDLNELIKISTNENIKSIIYKSINKQC